MTDGCAALPGEIWTDVAWLSRDEGALLDLVFSV